MPAPEACSSGSITPPRRVKALAGFLLVFLLPFLVVSCGGNGSDAVQKALPDLPGASAERFRAAESPAPSPVSLAGPTADDGGTIRIESPKIIREGQIVFETSDLAATRTGIDTLVTLHKGYLSEERQYKYDDRIEERLVIRVPADNFGALVSDLEKSVRRFDSKTVSARDVTEDFIDVSRRLAVKKETEKRYLGILSKAKTVRDILEVERALGRVRADIESFEGRLKYLENRTGFSTLTITFYQLKPESVGFASQFRVALSDGWNNFMLFLIGAVSLWPFILAGLALLLVLFFITGRKKTAG